MNQLYSTIIELIHESKYHEAKMWYDQLNKSQQRDLVVEEASLTDNMCIIGFVEFLISKDCTYFNHMLAAEVLIQMCWIEGAYNVSFYHAVEMYKLNPSIDSKKFLLFFYDLPEKIMPETFAIELATSIIKTDPYYIPARKILQSHDKLE